ncbi:MAG: ABC transporter ATP-binding protein [Geminicoccaceae bacterium]|nr:ABC transporter ATP-binding protein [Geminicoccaceae bacterium]MCX8101987.1 ABC transporter ATP-binding protein [Geminicoccaceae bacterium]MDW8369330.1 ABC transporter ATP-binding protein [Geminicoccaceae bacterium]
MSLLEARGISIAFGGLRALDQVGFAVDRGRVLAIIGPNGAGKTTLFNVVTGLYRAQAGEVRLDGREVTGLPPHALAARGLARTFQNLQIFFRMSALENVMVGRHLKERRRLWAELLGLPSVLRENRESREKARELLVFVGLEARAEEPASALPYGALKRLEIARALACEPSVLMLDEPAAGCNPVETEEIDRLILAIARRGVAVVLVEHDMKLVMRISDRVLVLDQGRVLAEGTPAEVRSDPRVVEAYLGRHGLEAARAA